MWVPSSRRRVSGVLAMPISASGALRISSSSPGSFAGRDPPGGGRLGDREFGQLVEDLDIAQLRLVREFVAEADAVVIDAEHDREPAVATVLLLDLDAQLAVAVAHELALAPGLLPGRIVLAHGLPAQRETAVELGRIGQVEAEARQRDDLLAAPLHRIAELAAAIDLHLDLDHLVGRGRAGDYLLGPGIQAERERSRQDGGDAAEMHAVVSLFICRLEVAKLRHCRAIPSDDNKKL
jgi:hypothetical protein